MLDLFWCLQNNRVRLFRHRKNELFPANKKDRFQRGLFIHLKDRGYNKCSSQFLFILPVSLEYPPMTQFPL
jgi:hypothetical protein